MSLLENEVISKDLQIKATMSQWSKDKFIKDVHKLEKFIDKNTQIVLIKMFLQLGRNGNLHDKTFEFIDKNESILFIQPKIKNYITFKTLESADRYIVDEAGDNDLNLFLEVKDGKIIIDNL